MLQALIFNGIGSCVTHLYVRGSDQQSEENKIKTISNLQAPSVRWRLYFKTPVLLNQLNFLRSSFAATL